MVTPRAEKTQQHHFGKMRRQPAQHEGEVGIVLVGIQILIQFAVRRIPVSDRNPGRGLAAAVVGAAIDPDVRLLQPPGARRMRQGRPDSGDPPAVAEAPQIFIDGRVGCGVWVYHPGPVVSSQYPL